MKALILAAGKGTRLKPLTNTRPKHLIPIANKPIIFYGLEQIKEAGITDIGIVISQESGPGIKAAVSNGHQWGVNISYILQEKPLGLAHAVKTAREFLSNSNFLLFLGDNILKEGMRGLLDEFQKNPSDALIVVKEVPDPRQFGVAEFNSSGNAVRVIEKPQTPGSNLALVGAYVFTPIIFQAIDRLQPSSRGEYEITDAIQMLIDMGLKVRSHILSGWWMDTGKKEDLIEANNTVLNEYLKTNINVTLDPGNRLHNIEKIEILRGSVVENSTIWGPVTIAEDCRIIDSFIGPFSSIGPHTVIENSKISKSIIMDYARINNITHLTNSIIGKNVQIKKCSEFLDIIELFSGDNATVEL